jgi:hypothetical protein
MNEWFKKWVKREHMFSCKFGAYVEKTLLDAKVLDAILKSTRDIILEQPALYQKVKEGLIHQVVSHLPEYQKEMKSVNDIEQARNLYKELFKKTAEQISEQEILFITLQFNKIIYRQTGKLPSEVLLQRFNKMLRLPEKTENKNYGALIKEFREAYQERTVALELIKQNQKVNLLPERLQNWINTPALFAFSITQEEINEFTQNDQTNFTAPQKLLNFFDLADPQLEKVVTKIREKISEDFLVGKVFHEQKADIPDQKLFLKALTEKLVLNVLNQSISEQGEVLSEEVYQRILMIKDLYRSDYLTEAAKKESKEIKKNLEVLRSLASIVQPPEDLFVLKNHNQKLNSLAFLVSVNEEQREILKPWLQKSATLKKLLGDLRNIEGQFKALSARGGRYPEAHAKMNELAGGDSWSLLKLFGEQPGLIKNLNQILRSDLHAESTHAKLMNFIENLEKSLRGEELGTEIENETQILTAEEIAQVNLLIQDGDSKKVETVRNQQMLNRMFFITMFNLYAKKGQWQDKKRAIELKSIYRLSWEKEEYIFYMYRDKDSKLGHKGLYLELVPVQNKTQIKNSKSFVLSHLLEKESIKRRIREQKKENPYKADEEILMELLIRPEVVRNLFAKDRVFDSQNLKVETIGVDADQASHIFEIENRVKNRPQP